MANRGYILSEDDRRAIADMLGRERRRPVSRVTIPNVPEQEIQTPEIYVARTPTPGIAALTMELGTGINDYPGSAECDIYRVVDVSGRPELQPIDLQVRVYNLFTGGIAGQVWCLVARDKFGQWWVTGDVTSDGLGTGTDTGTPGTVTSVDVSGGTTGLTTSGGPITTSGTITLAGTLALANGGTGASLSDPSADRIMFWDDSAGQVTWLTAGTGLSISGTTISNSGVVSLAGDSGGALTGALSLTVAHTGSSWAFAGSGTTITLNAPVTSATVVGVVNLSDQILGAGTKTVWGLALETAVNVAQAFDPVLAAAGIGSASLMPQVYPASRSTTYGTGVDATSMAGFLAGHYVHYGYIRTDGFNPETAFKWGTAPTETPFITYADIDYLGSGAYRLKTIHRGAFGTDDIVDMYMTQVGGHTVTEGWGQQPDEMLSFIGTGTWISPDDYTNDAFHHIYLNLSVAGNIVAGGGLQMGPMYAGPMGVSSKQDGAQIYYAGPHTSSRYSFHTTEYGDSALMFRLYPHGPDDETDVGFLGLVHTSGGSTTGTGDDHETKLVMFQGGATSVSFSYHDGANYHDGYHGTLSDGTVVKAGLVISKGAGGGAGSGTVTSVNVSGGTTGLTFSGGPITSSGTITMAGTLALANGGTGASLSDPSADRIMFWDDSAGQVTWLTAGTGLSISGTTISASGGDAATLDGIDSTGFLILAGQVGGQSANGGTGASDVLTLASTSHGTKGGVKIGTDDWLHIPELAAAPEGGAAPPTGFGYIYEKSDGLLYFKNDANTEYDLTASSGSVATDTIWDAKGDLAVGTGANTAAKLTVGANGTFPIAASGETTGILWGTDNSFTAADVDLIRDVIGYYDASAAAQRQHYVNHIAGAINAGVCDHRLTTESGVSVSTSDRTSQSYIYLTPHVGKRIAIHDGTRWHLVYMPEIGMTIVVSSGSNYDVLAKWIDNTPSSTDTGTDVVTFGSAHGWATGSYAIIYTSGGGLTAGTDYWIRAASSTTVTFHPTLLDAISNTNTVNLTANVTAALTGITLKLSAAWSSDTARADALTTQDGVYVKSGDVSQRHVGLIRGSGANVTEDSEANRYVISVVNPVRRFMRVRFNYADDSAYTSFSVTATSYAEMNSGTNSRINFLIPYAWWEYSAELAFIANQSGSIEFGIGLGIDSTSTVSQGGYWGGAFAGSNHIAQSGYTGIGKHYIAGLGYVSSGTGTVYTSGKRSGGSVDETWTNLNGWVWG